jgi:predicted phage-related endonuclease
MTRRSDLLERQPVEGVAVHIPEKPGDCFSLKGTRMRIAIALAATLFGGALLASPAAFADPARDNLLRAETQIQALNTADASAAAPNDYQSAVLRLTEARAAEAKNNDDESLRRSNEAMLLGEIVQEKIKLRGLQRTVTEIETGIATLRRELVS